MIKATAVAAAVTLVVAASAAAAEPRERVASVQHGDTLVSWSPLVDNAGLVLTVSGPGGFYSQQEFAGEAPSFSVFDRAGQTLPDGAYKWELTATPRLGPAEQRQLVAARAAGDSLAVEARIDSGAFSVRGGRFVSPEEEAPQLQRRAAEPTLATRDFVIADDLIVQGSACVGFDCVNNENFSFDTIRLKENNLRIKFEDTSGGSFPTRDWEITANDSASGGLDRFSVMDVTAARIPFTIEGNADANSLYVDTGKRVGIGTNTPVLNLHVKTGNTPALRLEQDSSSGFTPQTWDVAGNETNFFVRDATNGSTLPFRIQPAAPSSSIFVKATSGDVGLGTASPAASLHVRRTSGTGQLFVEEASATEAVRTMMQLTNNGRVRWQMTDTSADGRVWTFFSSEDNFNISSSSTAGQEFVLTGTGNLTITGALTVGPGGCTGCDQVFQPGYPIESIDEHADRMWQNSYLPGVGPTPEDAPMNLSAKTGGILNELEKAHIYIEQLHRRLEDKEAQVGELAERLERLERRLGGDM